MSVLSRLTRSTRNALELVRLGKLGPEYSAPYDVVDEGAHHKLRRYATRSSGRGTPLAGEGSSGPSVLLVPPLMVASEIYDIEAALSAVAALGRAGITPHLVDFGAPERSADGRCRLPNHQAQPVGLGDIFIDLLTVYDGDVVAEGRGLFFPGRLIAVRRGEHPEELEGDEGVKGLNIEIGFVGKKI